MKIDGGFLNQFFHTLSFIASIGILLDLILTAVYFILRKEYSFRKKQLQKLSSQQTLKDKIQHLTKSLKKATDTINEIENELSEKQRLVQKLENDSETYSTLLTLKKDEVEAIANALQTGAKKQNRKSFWISIIVNFIFFILGAIVSYLTSKYT